MNNDELMHYGVLGMKWGVHKARLAGKTYTYTSHSTKKWNKKTNRLQAKSEKAASKGNKAKASYLSEKATKASKIAKRSKQHDKAMQDASEKANIGAVAVSNAMLGLWANKTYHSLQASGMSKTVAAGSTVVNSMLQTGPLMAAVVKSAYIHDIN